MKKPGSGSESVGSAVTSKAGSGSVMRLKRIRKTASYLDLDLSWEGALLSLFVPLLHPGARADGPYGTQFYSMSPYPVPYLVHTHTESLTKCGKLIMRQRSLKWQNMLLQIPGI